MSILSEVYNIIVHVRKAYDALARNKAKMPEKKTVENLESTIDSLEILNSQEKMVSPSVEDLVVIPDEEYNALSKVTVLGDVDLAPENIKKGVSIFGVLGTLEDSVKVYSTTDEMNQNTDFPENTLAVIFDGVTYTGTYKLDSGVWTHIGEPTDYVEMMHTLNDTDNNTLEYEGTGATDEELHAILDDILGDSEYVKMMNTLNTVDNNDLEYEGVGGTDEELDYILDDILGSSEYVQALNTLETVDNVATDYEGLGGTEEEVHVVLDDILGNEEV